LEVWNVDIADFFDRLRTTRIGAARMPRLIAAASRQGEGLVAAAHAVQQIRPVNWMSANEVLLRNKNA
jgi:hypothetical protein